MQYSSPIEQQTQFEKKVIETSKTLASNKDLKIDLAKLHFVKAEEVPVDGDKKAAVIYVPVEELPAYQQASDLCAAFAKQFQGYEVFIAGARKTAGTRKNKDYFKSIKYVNECLEDDICAPFVVQGRRTLYQNAKPLQKIVLKTGNKDSFGGRANVAQKVISKLTKRPVEILFL